MLSSLWNDIRYAVRSLCGSPGFAAAAIVTIALGIGINTGIFSLLNGFVFRDLPAPDAEELVGIAQIIEDDDVVRATRGWSSGFSTAEYRRYRDGIETLSGLMGYSRPYTVTLGMETPHEIEGAAVTCNYFDVLEQSPALGPGFSPDCDAPGTAPTVVLGHELWMTAFDADPDVVGRQVELNRQSFTVVGIAPKNMRGVDREPVSVFAPISTQPRLAPGWNVYEEPQVSWLALVGRRAGEAGLDEVRAELGVIAARIDAEQPPRRTRLVVARATLASSPEVRTVFLSVGAVVLAAFGVVLLIACANVANLLLARATGRAREIAVRMSLGASRARIVQQLLAESAVIALLGGALGFVLALSSFQGLFAFALSALPADAIRLAVDTSPDGRVLAYAFVLTLATGVLSGLAPALQASKPQLYATIKADATGGERRAGDRLQGAFVGVQVALCMMLMIAAGLLVRGLYATQTVEPGFDYENVLVASFELDGAGYDAEAAAAFQRQFLERVRALPGVDAVAQAALGPLSSDDMDWSARLPDQEQWFGIGFNRVSPGYFSLLGIPIVRGRTFTDSELEDGSTAAIVTEAAARRYWPGGDPIGRTLTWSGGAGEPRELRIVGIAADAQVTRIGELASDYVYLPATTRDQSSVRLLARSRTDLDTTASAVRAVAADLDPALVVRVAPLEANLDVWRGLASVVSTLSVSLGGLAVVLAAVGIYGVVAYAVGRRLREIGIRMALGARAYDVLALILKRTMRPVVVGAVIGVAAAAAASDVLSSVLFGVSPVDPIGLAGAALFVLFVALTTGLLAARRATQAEPSATLRCE